MLLIAVCLVLLVVPLIVIEEIADRNFQRRRLEAEYRAWPVLGPGFPDPFDDPEPCPEPCEDCGKADCDCGMQRWAHEALYGDEDREYRDSLQLHGWFDREIDDPNDDPRTHSDECCCESCLQNYPERDALYGDGTYFIDLDTDPEEYDDQCPYCEGRGVFHIINLDTQKVRSEDCEACDGTGERVREVH